MNYTIVSTVEIDENQMPKERGAINGGLMQRQAPINSPVITISVADIEKALEKIVQHGGSVVRDKFQVGDIGYSAYVKDTEGNIIGLWQNLRELGQ